MKLDVRLAAALFVLAACEAGGNYGFGGSGASSGDDDDGDGVKAGTPASTGQGFMTGGDATGTTGTGVSCGSDECITDAEQMPCDSGLQVTSADPMDAAKAIGLCKQSNGSGWGVTSAAYTTSDGQPLTGVFADGRGILPRFGSSIMPREGVAMLALSSGAARNPGDPGYQSPSGYNKAPGSAQSWPSGFTLQESPACPGTMTGAPYDSAMLEVKIKTPTNAKSFTYDLDFYTFEFPNYICSTFNDYFVALMTPPPAGSIQGNISFDGNGNFISVNAGFLTVCESQIASNFQTFPCALGPGELSGTGFDEQNFNIATFEQTLNSAATSWLQTSAPIEAPGSEITLRFAIWDSGDADLDSTILIDNFKFSFEEGTIETEPVPK